MGWGEVKKINSDLNVPLNERMGYVGGIIPRGALKNVVSKSISSTTYNGTLLSISGKGFIAAASVSVNTVNWNSYAEMKITIDDDKIITIGDTANNYGVRKNASLTLKLTEYASTVDTEFPITIPSNAAITVNEPIFFEKSIKVDVSLYGSSSSQEVSASFSYAIL